MRYSDATTVKSHLTLEERIRARAHQIWLSREGNRAADTSLADWLAAEREVLGEDPHSSAQNRGSVVGSAYKPEFRTGSE